MALETGRSGINPGPARPCLWSLLLVWGECLNMVIDLCVVEVEKSKITKHSGKDSDFSKICLSTYSVLRQA